MGVCDCVAGWRLGINPFDQPNVQEAKDATKELLSSFERRGHFERKARTDDAITIYCRRILDANQLKKFCDTSRDGKARRLHRVPELHRRDTRRSIEKFQELRTQLRDATKCAVTIGYGPRFLHSTGQLHKGGPDTGVFFQIIANDENDFADSGRALHFQHSQTGAGARRLPRTRQARTPRDRHRSRKQHPSHWAPSEPSTEGCPIIQKTRILLTPVQSSTECVKVVQIHARTAQLSYGDWKPPANRFFITIQDIPRRQSLFRSGIRVAARK